MRVLVDTSVWVAHFKRRNEQLVALLDAGLVVCHPHVVVEVACGTPPNRQALIALLSRLDQATVATSVELLAFLERHQLFGRGCGLVDLSLLASSLLTPGTVVWTFDQRLQALLVSLGRSYQPAPVS